MQRILSRSGYFAANGLLRTVKTGLWGRPPASLHYAASVHSSRRTTIRLFYIAHRGQSDEDSGRVVGKQELIRSYELFSLPGLLRSSEKPTVRSYETKLSEDEIYTVRWAIIRSSDLSTERLFEAIANQDHGRTPSVRGRVHILDPGAEVLLHMYDDRGMDVIATSVAPLLTLKSPFSSWINREKLDGNDSAQSSSPMGAPNGVPVKRGLR